ncbi:MAG: DUF373 family protein [Nitrososphaeria archaeon]
MAGKVQERVLVLCVDRDNDLYQKTGIISPVVGREECLRAAENLAIADPEEADANAIFAAIKEYDNLTSKGLKPEIAIITGTFEGGVEADIKIRKELSKILENFKVDGIVFVSDGVEDEILVPVIQSLAPILSVKRIVIKHSKSVEESYMIIGKYLKMLVFDPRYSRYFLGLPGVFLLIFATLIYFNLVTEALIGILFFLGILFIIRGFSLDKIVGEVRKLTPSSYIRIFSIFGMLIMYVIAFYRGGVGLGATVEFKNVIANPSQLLEYFPFLLGIFLENALIYMWFGAGIYYVGQILRAFIKDTFYKVFRYTIGIITLALLYFPFLELSQVLKDPNRNPFSVVSTILIGLSLLFVIISFTYIRVSEKRRERIEDAKKDAGDTGSI